MYILQESIGIYYEFKSKKKIDVAIADPSFTIHDPKHEALNDDNVLKECERNPVVAASLMKGVNEKLHTLFLLS